MTDEATERLAREALIATLQKIPGLGLNPYGWIGWKSGQPSDPTFGIGMVVKQPSGDAWEIRAEAKTGGHPKQARQVAWMLKHHLAKRGRLTPAYGVFIAPYISPEAAAVCAEEGIGYLDLSGNCHLAFGGVYIHVAGQPNQFKSGRRLKSLYSPKAERILRVLFGRPRERWLVKAMSNEAQVSLGTVSNLRKLLDQQEWLDDGGDGFRLKDTAAILEDWRENYDRKRSREFLYYSFMGELELAAALDRSSVKSWAITGLNASRRYAFMVPTETISVYVDGSVDDLAAELGLRPASGSGNIRLIQPYDEGVFYGGRQATGEPSLRLVSPIQTYLDLKGLGGRSDEAAEFLYREVIQKQWQES